MARSDGSAHAEVLCTKLGVKFPCEMKEFIEKEVSDRLPPATRAWFMTSDCLVQKTYQPLLHAVAALKLPAHIFTFEAGGPTIAFPKTMGNWRSHDTIRVFIEASALAGIGVETIADDLRKMFGVDFDEQAIRVFCSLFVDLEYAAPEFWPDYVKCVGQSDARFKRMLMGQPRDFVRWKLGVPVHIASDLIFDRMISDAYYAERLIKAETGGDLSGPDMTRIKMERDTLFKAMDRRQKYREATGGESSKEALTAIKQLVAQYESYDDGPVLEDLQKHNASTNSV